MWSAAANAPISLSPQSHSVSKLPYNIVIHWLHGTACLVSSVSRDTFLVWWAPFVPSILQQRGKENWRKLHIRSCLKKRCKKRSVGRLRVWNVGVKKINNYYVLTGVSISRAFSTTQITVTVIHFEQSFSTWALVTFWVRQCFAVGDCSVHYRLFSRIPGLLLDANGTIPPQS